VDWFEKYFSWRPILTVDQFWIAALKVLPYEITGAYIIIVGGYLTATGGSTVSWLLLAVIILSIATFFLHRTTASAGWIASLATASLFLLFALAVHADVFRPLLVAGTISFSFVPNLLEELIRPFPILIVAIVIVLATASLRKILGKPG